jgi:hypothetical protein
MTAHGVTGWLAPARTLKASLTSRLAAYNEWQVTDLAGRDERRAARRHKHAGTRKPRPARLRPWRKAEQVAAAIEAAARPPEDHAGPCANLNCMTCLRVRAFLAAGAIARRVGGAL